MTHCERHECNNPRDQASPLFLCNDHQLAVDAKNLGWDWAYRRINGDHNFDITHWKEVLYCRN